MLNYLWRDMSFFEIIYAACSDSLLDYEPKV